MSKKPPALSLRRTLTCKRNYRRFARIVRQIQNTMVLCIDRGLWPKDEQA